jgi:hypothetical protein
MIIGDIVCVKTTGERVCVLNQTRDIVQVRRPVGGPDGSVSHEVSEFNEFELETLKDHAARQVSEMILKANAQKELIQAETQIETELQAENVIAMPAKKKADPSVN